MLLQWSVLQPPWNTIMGGTSFKEMALLTLSCIEGTAWLQQITTLEKLSSVWHSAAGTLSQCMRTSKTHEVSLQKQTSLCCSPSMTIVCQTQDETACRPESHRYHWWGCSGPLKSATCGTCCKVNATHCSNSNLGQRSRAFFYLSIQSSPDLPLNPSYFWMKWNIPAGSFRGRNSHGGLRDLVRKARVLLLLYKHAWDFSFAQGCSLRLLGTDQEPCPMSQGLTPEARTLRRVPRATWWRTKAFSSEVPRPPQAQRAEEVPEIRVSSTKKVRQDNIFTPGQVYRNSGVCDSHFTKSRRGPKETYSPIEGNANLIPQRAPPSKPQHKDRVSPLIGVDDREETGQVMTRSFFFLSFLS